MNNICSLTELKPGHSAVVTRISVRGGIRRRLRDIGLIEGTSVECAFKSPSGDPAAYFIRGALIAMRSEDTRDISVSV